MLRGSHFACQDKIKIMGLEVVRDDERHDREMMVSNLELGPITDIKNNSRTKNPTQHSKRLVSPLVTPIVVPYIIPPMTSMLGGPPILV